MPRNTVAIAFFSGLLFFSFGLLIAANRGVTVAFAPYVSTLEAALTVGLVYLVGTFLLPRPKIRLLTSRWRRIIYWMMFGSMIAASLAFIRYAPTSASVELIKQTLNPSYHPTTDELSIRLSTAMMPLWAQALFDISRRVAAVYCLVEFFYSDLFGRHRLAVGAGLVAVLVFFVVSTLDRLIPVLYLSAAVIASLATMKWRALARPAIYLNTIAIVLSIVVLRHIQYGTVTPVDFRGNTEIAKTFEAAPVTPKETKEIGICDSEGRFLVVRYIQYAACTSIERIVLSPVAMVVYAAQNYNESNYLHWSTTRLFSIFGFGRYVDPLEQGKLTHHDAFPLSFVGDLWRNGGPVYFLPFAVLMGGALLLINRLVFARADQLAPQMLALFGFAFFFYGNAFNVTSWAMITSALCISMLSMIPGFGKR